MQSECASCLKFCNTYLAGTVLVADTHAAVSFPFPLILEAGNANFIYMLIKKSNINAKRIKLTFFVYFHHYYDDRITR